MSLASTSASPSISRYQPPDPTQVDFVGSGVDVAVGFGVDVGLGVAVGSAAGVAVGSGIGVMALARAGEGSVAVGTGVAAGIEVATGGAVLVGGGAEVQARDRMATRARAAKNFGTRGTPLKVKDGVTCYRDHNHTSRTRGHEAPSGDSPGGLKGCVGTL